MPYLNTKVYPLTTSTKGTLSAGNNEFLKFSTLTFGAPYTIATAQGVFGTVTDTQTPSSPIEGAYVALVPPSGNVVSMVKTDANGMYSLGAQSAGTYQIDIIANGYDIYTNSSVNIASNTYESLGTIALTTDSELDNSSSVAIIGTFKDQISQNSINDGILTLYDMTNPASPVVAGLTVTNTSGEFAFIGVQKSKSYSVMASSLTNNIVEVPVDWSSLQGSFLTMNLSSAPIVVTSYSLIQGNTDNENNEILPNTAVILYEGTSPTGTAIAYTKSNNNGYYAFTVPNVTSDTSYYVECTNNIS